VQRLDGHGDRLELGADLVHACRDRSGADRAARSAAAEREDGAMDAADHVGDRRRELGELVGRVGAVPGRRSGQVPRGVRAGVEHGYFIGRDPVRV
jgi:hypothetical protein